MMDLWLTEYVTAPYTVTAGPFEGGLEERRYPAMMQAASIILNLYSLIRFHLFRWVCNKRTEGELADGQTSKLFWPLFHYIQVLCEVIAHCLYTTIRKSSEQKGQFIASSGFKYLTRLERWSIASHRLTDGAQPSKTIGTRWLGDPKTIGKPSNTMVAPNHSIQWKWLP